MSDEITFGPFRLDRGRELLWRDGAQVEIQPRPFAVLRYLAERPGVLVTRAELLEAIWHDAHVSRSVVKVAVRAIREALDDDAAQPEYVETVGRQGYRFLVGDAADTDAVRSVLPPVVHATRAVGRNGELDALRQVLETAKGGRRQLVFITGEPGIGKTTLVDEFLADGRDRVNARIARGQCLEQYAAGEAYLPVHDALRQLCQGPERGEVLTVLRRYAPAWLAQQPALLPDDEWAELQEVLRGVTQERLLREVAEAIEALAVGRPLILVLEDLHWSDTSTIELLARLAQRREDARLVVVGTYRPTDLIVHDHSLHDVKRELSAKGLCSELALELLTAAEVAEYLAQRMDDDAATALGREVHSWTEGNPLFMTGVVQELLAQGIVSEDGGRWQLGQSTDAVAGTIPGGVRGLIEKQFVRLRPEQQRVLEIASLTSGEFAAAAVAAAAQQDVDAVDELCEELAGQGRFLRETGLAEWPDGTVSGRYRFGHALFREVLGTRISGARRARMHRRLGERQEQGWGDLAPEHAPELAMHFAEGRQFLKAARYHDVAGEGAARQNAHREAAWHVEQALALAEQEPAGAAQPEAELDRRMKLGMSLTATRGYSNPEAEQAFARALELAAALDESPQLLPAYRGLREYYVVRGELERGRSFGERMLHVVEQDAPSGQGTALRAEALFSVGSACFYMGRLDEAREYHERTLAEYDPTTGSSDVMYGHDPAVTALSELSAVLWLQGHCAEGHRRAEEALTIVRERAHPFGLAHALAFDGLVHFFSGAIPRAIERADELQAVAAEHGFPHWLAMSTFIRGAALADADDPSEGIGQLQFAIGAYEAVGAKVGITHWRTVLAAALGKAGRVDEGLTTLQDTFALMEQTGERVQESELHRLHGELTLLAPLPAKTRGSAKAAATRERRTTAERDFQRAMELAAGRGARALELRAAVSLARLWSQQHKADDARALLAPLVAGFRDDLTTRDLAAARTLLDGD